MESSVRGRAHRNRRRNKQGRRSLCRSAMAAGIQTSWPRLTRDRMREAYKMGEPACMWPEASGGLPILFETPLNVSSTEQTSGDGSCCGVGTTQGVYPPPPHTCTDRQPWPSSRRYPPPQRRTHTEWAHLCLAGGDKWSIRGRRAHPIRVCVIRELRGS